MTIRRSTGALLGGVCAATLFATAIGSAQAPQAQPAPAQAPAAGAPQGARAGSPNPLLFTAFDADKDGSVTRPEIKSAFDRWYDAADTTKSGSVTVEQLGTTLNAAVTPPAVPPAPGDANAPAAAAGRAGGGGRAAGPEPAVGSPTPGLNEPCGGRSQQPTVPCAADVEKMMAALPTTAPAKPVRPRKVLIWSRIPSAGYQHSSIPLASKTIEEMGKKTGAWTSDTSWDPAVFTTENLKQYDAIFLSSTTGCFLDKAGDKATTDARRAALIDFVRGGKGLAGVHATGDSYHQPCPNDENAGGRGGGGFGRGGGTPGASVASVMLRWAWGLNDQKLVNNEQTLTKADMEAVANAWFDTVDTAKSGKVSQQDFLARGNGLTATNANGTTPYLGNAGRDNGRGSWPDYDRMIGAFFKYHWYDGQKITVKIDDPKSAITAPFKGQAFDVVDEIYTFSMDTYSRKNLRILTSLDYSKMSLTDKLKESNPRADHDFGLSWIHRDGNGRVFYHALGHNERIYAMKPILESMLAGMQYALGDLKVDDSPSQK
ncbi:MAG: ThuA domain-containing protein [Vicinamibacterales bacterium]